MLDFKRVKQQNFYVAKVGNHTILKSYNTIVGIIVGNYILYEVKYSRTTSKKVSQYFNQCLRFYDSDNNALFEKHIISSNELKDKILFWSNLDIDTRYNCA